MSRDQKPGKMKLVTTGAIHHPHHERFEEEEISSDAFDAAVQSEPSSARGSTLLALLFLLASALGGAGVVFGAGLIR